METEKNLGIYIHVPFCIHKCPYCGFLSAPPESDDEVENYMDHLVKEVGMAGGAYGGARKVDTVFIGGGTPSLLSSEQIWFLMNAIDAVFDLADDPEITLEANPGTLTSEKLSAYRNCGINRLSMGAQAMDDDLLWSLGRIHRKEDVVISYELARSAGFDNINLDLMFGMPGQDMPMWEDTLRQIFEMDPEHVSFYSLQIEEKTPFYDMYRDGKLDTANDRLEREMHHRAISMLSDAGFTHYEISNSAKAGRQCRHNLKYRSMDEYLGLGLGAHSYMISGPQKQSEEDSSAAGEISEAGSAVGKTAAGSAAGKTAAACNFTGGIRYNNKEDLSGYFDSIEQGRLPIDQTKVRTDTLKDAMGVFVFTGLRKREGVDLKDFEERFGTPFTSAFDIREMADKWRAEGLIELTDSNFRLTEKGIDKSNDIMSEFV